MSWVKDAAAGFFLAVFLACMACTPIVAPYGLADLFGHHIAKSK